MCYTHLSQDERYQIQHLHGGGFSAREIGTQLECAATTISRELRRNQGDADKYHARPAWFGVQSNADTSNAALASTPQSHIEVRLVPTDEEAISARHTLDMIHDDH